MNQPVPACRITRSTLSGGRRAGVELLEVDNGAVRLVLLPQRGMGIWKAWCGGVEFGWHSPVQGPVHPSHVPVGDASGKGWLEGFDELLCRCGLRSNGAPAFGAGGQVAYPLHGRIANLPAEPLDIRRNAHDGGVEITGAVHEARFLDYHLQLRSSLRLRPGECGFAVHDEVTNLGGTPCEAQLLYHYNLGTPLLGAGARLHAPVAELAPRDEDATAAAASWDQFAGPQAGFREQVYYSTLHARPDGTTAVLLCSGDGQLGASLRFNRNQLPCFAVWKNTADLRDGYVMGIEPATNFPNPRPFEEAQGRTVKLEPGESCSFDLQFGFHLDEASVRSAQHEVASIAGGRAAHIHVLPRQGWTPGVAD